MCDDEYDRYEGEEALREELDEAQAKVVELQAILTQIRAGLSEVAVYEGLPIGNESLVLYLSELVRDHSELEARIDAALMRCALPDRLKPELDLVEVARLLKGGTRIPDSPDGLQT